jgi:glycosyltransferase involved in cell wall biosynthesis
MLETMIPSLSVVVCSLDGTQRLGRCLDALESQTIRPSLQLIVVDDGSALPLTHIARKHGATVIRHENTQGISAARNAGIRAANAPIVGFLDDDCEPAPDWAERVVQAFSPHDVAVGGPLLVPPDKAYIMRFLARHNPLDPQEFELTRSDAPSYRLYLYLKRLWIVEQRHDRRRVFSLASANMSVRRSALLAVGGFDERILFGSEDEDLCRRLMRAYPDQQVTFDPSIRVVHHFQPSLRDTLRRSRAYGRGSAAMYRKWPNASLTLLPFPIVVLILLLLSSVFPAAFLVALLAPYLFYPKGLRGAITNRDSTCLLDPYVLLLRESFDVCGLIDGLWRFRDFSPETPSLIPRAQAMSFPPTHVQS